MSAKAMFWALDLEGLSSTQKLVLILLANHANEDDVCWPSITRLTKKAGLGRATVFRALDELERQGIVTRTERVHEKGGRSTSLFTLQIEASVGVSARPVVSDPPSHSETPPVSPRDPPRLTVRPHESNIEPITSNQTPSHSETSFDLWWESYPRKAAKGSARKAYASALKKVPADSLLKLTKAFDFGKDEKFIPHPATWLNAERWIEAEADTDTTPRMTDEEVHMMFWTKNRYWNADWGPRPDKRATA